MLGKLLKYEFKATGRIFLPLYAALIVLALVNKALFSINSSFLNNLIVIPQGLSAVLYVMMIVAVFVVTFIVIIQRFYKNLLKDEGYLMFTLPVSTNSLIMSKLIVGTVWMIVSVLVTILSIFIMAFSMDFFTIWLPRLFGDTFQVIGSKYGIRFISFLIEFILFALIGVISEILMIYCSMALGNLAGKHKVLASVGAYFVLYTIVSTIVGILMVMLGVFSVNHVFDTISGETAAHLTLWGCIIFNTVFSIAYYLITHIILKKRLNLE